MSMEEEGAYVIINVFPVQISLQLFNCEGNVSDSSYFSREHEYKTREDEYI